MKVVRSHLCRGFHAEGDPEPGRCDWYTRKGQGDVYVRCALPRGHQGGHREGRLETAMISETIVPRPVPLG